MKDQFLSSSSPSPDEEVSYLQQPIVGFTRLFCSASSKMSLWDDTHSFPKADRLHQVHPFQGVGSESGHVDSSQRMAAPHLPGKVTSINMPLSEHCIRFGHPGRGPLLAPIPFPQATIVNGAATPAYKGPSFIQTLTEKE